VNSAMLDQFAASLTRNSLLDQSTVNFVRVELQRVIAQHAVNGAQVQSVRGQHSYALSLIQPDLMNQ
jgi:TnpA family transposase